ncbi:MAG TPA: DUF5670 family protein [Pyrinomonadaceae bacterium]|nr:DUF5670 family protein [Pyrinomonadaceae bacterium]
MLWVFALILLLLWMVGLIVQIGGQFTHWLLAIGLVMVIANLIAGRRPVL